jgi:hypothetical protein
VAVPRSLRAVWSFGVLLSQAAAWCMLVAALVTVCAFKGVNCFGDWSDV